MGSREYSSKLDKIWDRSYLPFHCCCLNQCLFVAFNSDGQAIAIKLSKQITKVTDNVKKTIACHNAIQGAAILTFDSVKDPSSDLYANVQSSSSLVHAIPNSTRRTAIELHCLKERCGEEISLVTSEMHRLVAFLRKQVTVLAMATEEVTEETAKVTLGLNSLFLSKRAEYGKRLHSLKSLWGELVPIPLEENDIALSYHVFLDTNIPSEVDESIESIEDYYPDSDSEYDSDE